jgi:rubrerythrin
MPCVNCGRLQDDPAKGASPWARAIVEGTQVLVCPECQQAHPGILESAERCPRCGSTRLQIQLGFHVCRQCGHNWEAVRT